MNTVALVGCGKMGGAMLAGWLSSGVVQHITVIDPEPLDRMRIDARIGLVSQFSRLDDLPDDLDPDIVVVAVKPQILDVMAAQLSVLTHQGATVLSVAAGKRIADFQAWLGRETPVVRAMPNTPSAVGRGASVLVAAPQVPVQMRNACAQLMAAVGTVDWVEDEALLDAVTAVSGGGPAYVFLLAEALAEAGIKAGLPADLARRIATQTVSGAGYLMAETGEDPAQLRRNVTSPNGTTQAALEVLMADDGIQPVLDRAVTAAAARSRALAG